MEFSVPRTTTAAAKVHILRATEKNDMNYDFTVGIKLEDIFVKQPSHLLASKDDSSLCARQKRHITLRLREHIHINTVKVAKHSHII